MDMDLMRQALEGIHADIVDDLADMTENFMDDTPDDIIGRSIIQATRVLIDASVQTAKTDEMADPRMMMMLLKVTTSIIEGMAMLNAVVQAKQDEE
jgi:hypothetical protein